MDDQVNDALSLMIVLRTDTFDLWRRCGLFLFFLDVGKHSTGALVLSDLGVGDALLVRIEDGAGQGDAFGTNLNSSICKRVGIKAFAHEASRQIVDLSSEALAVVHACQIRIHIAFVAQAKDLGEAIWLDGHRGSGAPEPRHARHVFIELGNSEHRMFVAVEGDKMTMLVQIVLQSTLQQCIMRIINIMLTKVSRA